MSIRKIYYKESTVRGWVHEIVRGMSADQWRPDYIVGLTRGGLVPATMLSHYLDVRMETLKVSLRDDSEMGPESNLWMAEDAFGYVSTDVVPRPANSIASDPATRKNILIVDDINDSGATLNWIKQDWQSGCLPNDSGWDNIWGYNVRVAVLINNEASDFKDVDYVGLTINKMEEPVWCVFPWEEWWH
jgi:hypoxanthine phosphoribosyltransferase